MRWHRIGMLPLSVLVLMGSLGMPGGVWAQEERGARAAGTAAEFVLSLPAFAAVVSDNGSSSVSRISHFERYCIAVCQLIAPVTLSSGAQLLGFELDAFDNDANAEIIAELYACPRGGAPCTLLAAVTTGLSEKPGHTQIRDNLPSSHTVDNGDNAYVLNIALGGTTIETRLTGLRVFYRLQVSPAPAVATFGDVPVGHPQHQYIQALVASGITAGCGGGNYCPDAPLTRGQMAVFLSKGLGLHFAP